MNSFEMKKKANKVVEWEKVDGKTQSSKWVGRLKGVPGWRGRPKGVQDRQEDSKISIVGGKTQRCPRRAGGPKVVLFEHKTYLNFGWMEEKTMNCWRKDLKVSLTGMRTQRCPKRAGGPKGVPGGQEDPKVSQAEL